MNLKLFNDIFSWGKNPEGIREQRLFALYSIAGRPLSLDPVSETYIEVDFRDLRIWDIQPYDSPEIWFMGNNPRPKIDYVIKGVSLEELAKLR